ncbi:hypothetical protein OH146_11020 [Salinibacterium sp. SYSU T00001]|uniref:hypothetical protein n=1 Tax=Homoserinimonas sedimenticola TaxID=2986805 RepID=UPI00223636F4|nr:hypothetical protein [Salinibacterium sedimenticola]MCW4386303.1 hypothetical protein [Salinibacterium sedimenticola]
MPRLRASLALCLLAALTLTACAPATPAPVKATEPDAQPTPVVFDSGAIAASADVALLEYWEAVAETYESGGTQTEALARVTTQDTFREEVALAEEYSRAGITMVPVYSANGTRFESLLHSQGELYLTISTCVDYSDARYIDTDGLTRPARENVSVAFTEVTFLVTEKETFDQLKVTFWSESAEPRC